MPHEVTDQRGNSLRTQILELTSELLHRSQWKLKNQGDLDVIVEGK